MKIKFWAGFSISVFFIWLAFRNVNFATLSAVLKEADYRYLIPATAVTLIQFLFRAMRWGHIVSPIKKTGLTSLFSATSIGFMGNNILPARIGEILRAYVFGKKEGISVSSAFATIVVERVFDTLMVIVLMFYVMQVLVLPPEKAEIEDILYKVGMAGLFVSFFAFFMLVIFKKNNELFIGTVKGLVGPFSEKISGKLGSLMGTFGEGLSVLSRGHHLIPIIAYSFLVWFFCILPIKFILLSFGYDFPFFISVFILVVIAFAVALPSAPGFIGTFHYAVALGLGLFNIPDEKALSVAIMLHAVNFFPITLVGLYFFWKERLSFSEISVLKEQD